MTRYTRDEPPRPIMSSLVYGLRFTNRFLPLAFGSAGGGCCGCAGGNDVWRGFAVGAGGCGGARFGTLRDCTTGSGASSRSRPSPAAHGLPV